MTGELIVSDDDAPSEAEKSGTGIHSIEDQGDKMVVTYITFINSYVVKNL